jgi:type I site-specific restriction-modification system R (restriction) subunit
MFLRFLTLLADKEQCNHRIFLIDKVRLSHNQFSFLENRKTPTNQITNRTDCSLLLLDLNKGVQVQHLEYLNIGTDLRSLLELS